MGAGMSVPWTPVIVLDIAGSLLVLLIAIRCAVLANRYVKARPEDSFLNYLFLFTLAIVCFALSRSFGHLVKQLLLLGGMVDTWRQVAPYSGATNSTTFVVIFAFSVYFHRFEKVYAEIEYYKNNLEEMIADRTWELERSKNTLQNILDNASPINITGVNFDLLQANHAYYEIWPADDSGGVPPKCYESRPGDQCHTDRCPLQQVLAGSDEVQGEVSKMIEGESRNFLLTARPFHDVDGTLIGMVESFLEITMSKRAERAMRESEERFRQIFESSPDPVVLSSADDGTIIDVNRAFEIATAVPRPAALGRTSGELGFWSNDERRLEFIDKLRSIGRLDNFEADFTVRDGRRKTGLLSARRINIAERSCIVMVIRDITTEKEAERALREMDRVKSEFISTAAHELNTPLSTILGYSEMLLDSEQFGDFDAEQKVQFIQEIHDRGEALCHLVEALLDIGRIETGHQMPLELQQTDLTETLRKKAEFFLVGGHNHAIHLELNGQAEQPLIMLDRHRINQVLDNLLSNAVKYSPDGGDITLGGGYKDGLWEIRIEDHGIGMTPEQVERIFDKFYRADRSDTAVSGLGLGMSIARQIIEAHGGKIVVESTSGKGTTVSFTLPVRQQSDTT
jgi:PAS domain S-box-containing protein